MPPWLELPELLYHVATIAAALVIIATTHFVWRQTAIQAQSDRKDKRRFPRESISAVHDTLQGEQFRNACSYFLERAVMRRISRT